MRISSKFHHKVTWGIYSFIHLRDLYSAPSRLSTQKRSRPNPAKENSLEVREELGRKGSMHCNHSAVVIFAHLHCLVKLYAYYWLIISKPVSGRFLLF